MNYDPSYCPKLRWPIDVSLQLLPADGPAANTPYAGQEVIVMNCPMGLLKEPLVLMKEIGPALTALDGAKSIGQIATELSSLGATPEIIAQLVDLLDQNYFLENERYRKALKQMRGSFTESKTRPAALAGGAYPPDPELLLKEVTGYLSAGAVTKAIFDSQMIGLVSPHIDYRRGGLCYGKTYNSLGQQEHDLYILMGTAHQYSELLFHLTEKSFESPFGLVSTDREFVGELAKSYGKERSFQDEYLHKNEHSLELQIPFLHHLRQQAAIVPILVGGFHHFLRSAKHPSQDERYEAFAESLSNCLRKRLQSGQKVCILLGVDMAHVGMHFGDKQRLSKDFMIHIAERDKIYLDAIEAQDKEKLFEHIAEDGDARRICGFPSMYTALDVMDRCNLQYSAQVFDYSQAVDYHTDCAVTFAGIGLYGKSL